MAVVDITLKVKTTLRMRAYLWLVIAYHRITRTEPDYDKVAEKAAGMMKLTIE